MNGREEVAGLLVRGGFGVREEVLGLFNKSCLPRVIRVGRVVGVVWIGRIIGGADC